MRAVRWLIVLRLRVLCSGRLTRAILRRVPRVVTDQAVVRMSYRHVMKIYVEGIQMLEGQSDQLTRRFEGQKRWFTWAPSNQIWKQLGVANKLVIRRRVKVCTTLRTAPDHGIS